MRVQLARGARKRMTDDRASDPRIRIMDGKHEDDGETGGIIAVGIYGAR